MPGQFETSAVTLGEVMDLGIIYAHFSNSVVLSINVLPGAVSTNDTLFIQDRLLFKIDTIYPIPVGESYYVFSFDFNNASEKTMSMKKRRHGINYRTGFHESIRTIGYYNINFCGQSEDTLTLTLN